MTRWELRFTGYGGQGVITSCFIYGRAATIYGGLDGAMAEAYGPEISGGFSRSDLVLAETVHYPLVEAADVMIAFSQDAYDTDRPSLKPGGILIAERDLVALPEGEEEKVEVHRISAVATADELGRRVVANIVLLGALTELVDYVAPDAVERAILDRVPKGTETLNMTAFNRGRELARASRAGQTEGTGSAVPAPQAEVT